MNGTIKGTTLLGSILVALTLSACATNGVDLSFDGNGGNSYQDRDDILKQMEKDSAAG